MLLRTPVREKVDQITDVLGDPRHLTPYYPGGLTEHILGPVQRGLIGVSRFYPFITPPVVVDFEPAPTQGRFYVEEKRAFFTARGVVYVPIFLREKMTREVFKGRVREALQILRTATNGIPTPPVTPATIDAVMATPEMRLRIDDEVAKRVPATPLYGAAKASWLVRTRAEVTEMLRQQVVQTWTGSHRTP